MRGIAIGEIAGIIMISVGAVMSAIGVIQAIKSRFHSLDAMILCIAASLIVSVGTVIVKLL